MKLQAACKIGSICGLNTVGEAVLNIDMHATNIFDCDKLKEELTELYEEYSAVGDKPIAEVYPKLRG